jgi:hypothetical protein
MDRRDGIGYGVGFFVFIAIGLWAVLDPTAMEGYHAVGARSGLKQLVAGFWGRGLGFTMMALGVLALVGLHTSE